jgi:hypothetical protein
LKTGSHFLRNNDPSILLVFAIFAWLACKF